MGVGWAGFSSKALMRPPAFGGDDAEALGVLGEGTGRAAMVTSASRSRWKSTIWRMSIR